ncbi:MAG TPA: hypothetical protein VMT52_00860 [Planctomycetota bacterium]|nr:hypothetical protein [Planctomycetota bacterium]
MVWTSLLLGGGALLVAAVGLHRDALIFRWTLHAISSGHAGDYALLRIRSEELPEDLAALEGWFLRHGREVLPQLRAEVARGDRARRLTVLQLIAMIQSDQGEKLDMEDLFRAMGDRAALDRLLAGRLDAALLGEAVGIHGRERTGVLLVRSSPERTTLWRVKASDFLDEDSVEAAALEALARREGKGSASGSILRTGVLEGEPHRRFRLAVAMPFTLPPFPEIGTTPEHAATLRVRFYLLGSDPVPAEAHFTGWRWLDAFAIECANLAERPLASEERPFEPGEALDPLLFLLEKGPLLAGEDAAWALLDLPLTAEEAEDARRRLYAVLERRVTGAASAAVALHFLGESGPLLEEVSRFQNEGGVPFLFFVRAAAARPDGVLRRVLETGEAIGVVEDLEGLLWKLPGLALDTLSEGDGAWLVRRIDRADEKMLEAFLGGALKNSAARLSMPALKALRRMPSSFRAEYLWESGIVPPAEADHAAWEAFLDRLEEQNAGIRRDPPAPAREADDRATRAPGH